jgi:hypothetical protein
MKRIAPLILSLLCLGGLAQSAYQNDAQAWLKLTLEKKISDRLALRLRNQDRFTNNVAELGRVKFDLGLTYKLVRGVRVRLGYAFMDRRKLSGTYSERHRWYAALLLKKQLKRWSVGYRNLFQSQYVDPFTSEDGGIAYFYDRHKVTLEYEYSKRISIYTAQELFIPLNNQQARGFDQSRTFLGLLYNLSKTQQVELFFLLKQRLQNGDWYDQARTYPNEPLTRDFVYGLGYTFEF